jgi:acetyl esterase/lipase
MSRRAELAGLVDLIKPATFIDVASAEVFRDEAVAYASQIWAYGGVAELHVWPGGSHSYELMAPHSH